MTFRSHLVATFERRRATNRRYSLRAFARSLATDHATLSQLLRQRRRMTARLVRRFGNRLGLDCDAIDEYCALEHEAAIVAALRHARFRADSRWLAVLLNIRIDDINIALQRLLRKRIITMAAGGRWQCNVEHD